MKELNLMPKIQLVAPHCPRCKQQGIIVRKLTVRSLLISEVKKRVMDVAYYLCMSSDCDVSYYRNASSEVFTISDVKVPIWYKKEAHPKYACYCNKITDEEVINVVKETGLSKNQVIIEYLREKVKCACAAMNPSGQCCTPLFPEAITIGLKARQEGKTENI
ncbi:MAG: (2Fe-2S)-binding protein [Asgard group archaeon]|nr:(2Fe-2S)-binding protein [Asgard group archaeon]